MRRLLLVVGTAAFIAPSALCRDPLSAPAMWLAAIVAAAIVLVSIARLTGTSLLEDERGRWSLARCQLLAWNLLLLPMFWTLFVYRLHAGSTNPLAVGFDSHIAWLLGISGASFVASPLILSRKRATPGLLARKRGGGIADLFRGEDAGNENVLDIGRVQIVFFTGVALLAYGAACFEALERLDWQFPPVTTDLLTILAISHATYLANKNTDRPASHSGDAGSTAAKGEHE